MGVEVCFVWDDGMVGGIFGGAPAFSPLLRIWFCSVYVCFVFYCTFSSRDR